MAATVYNAPEMEVRDMKKKSKKSAGARMRDEGRSLVWATFAEEDKQKIRTAAAMSDMPMSQFVTDAAIAAAEKILENFRKNGK